MRISLDERLKIAKLHIYEDIPIAQLARDFNADTGRVKYYVSLYKRWGEKTFKKNQQRVAYTRKLKLETIHEIMSKSISCRQKVINLMLADPTIIRDWVKMYKKYGEEGIKKPGFVKSKAFYFFFVASFYKNL